ncbi:MAG: Gp19/Gp15/Gp42 family protein [Mycobacteriaceae bacterium]
MANPLATTDDVADLWRPFTSTDEEARVSRLVAKASALLRQALPSVDARIARFNVDSADLGGLDPVTVATVVATMVKRYLVNPDGATNTSETAGQFSHAKGFALRGDKDVRGELIVTESDIAALTPASPLRPRMATLRTKALLAPRHPSSLDDSGPLLDPGMTADDNGWVLQDPGY